MSYYTVYDGQKMCCITTNKDMVRQTIHKKKLAFAKKFKTEKDAKVYAECIKQMISLNEKPTTQKINQQILIQKAEQCCVAYVDGSYSSKTGIAGYGAVILNNEEEIHLHGRLIKSKKITPDGSAAELYSVIKTIEYCVNELRVENIQIYHDADYITHAEKAKKKTEMITKYINCLNKAKKKGIKISFVNVKAHSGIKYNEIADTLAKQISGVKVKAEYVKRIEEVEVIRKIMNFKRCSFEEAKRGLASIMQNQ